MRRASSRRRATAGGIDGAIALIAILLVSQMWLAGCAGLYLFIERVDREVRGR